MNTTSTPPGQATVAFVLVSYRPDEPAGMERAVAGMAAGLRALNHQALILTAASQQPAPNVLRLRHLPVSFPCGDDTLRTTIDRHREALAHELRTVLTRRQVDIVVYVDGLWGLGRIAADIPTRGVLAVHVVGHRQDLEPALDGVTGVFAPSATVLQQAAAYGYPTESWRVLPNPLLVDPDDIARPDPPTRQELRRSGPVRIVARLGAEKGVADLLTARRPGARPVEIALGTASFEAHPGSQMALLDRCSTLARAAGVTLRPALRWEEVPRWLAGAAVTLVPSQRETFGNLAAESLSAGTPVVAYAIGNLPDLVGDAGILVHPAAGPMGLWGAVETLLADPVRYATTCGAAYYRSRDFRPTTVADAFLKAVW